MATKRSIWLLALLPLAAWTQDAQPANRPTTVDPANLSSGFYDVLRPRQLGPTTMGGRIMEIAVYEKEPRIFYVATASGGLWKTENGGITTRPVFHREASVALGSCAVDQNDPNRVWVGTGEGSSRNSTSWGDGVYLSEDGGTTWRNLGLQRSMHIPRVVLHPSNREVAYVAALGSLWGESDDRGVYKTSDGGKTWSRILFVDRRSGIADLVMNPRNPNELLAASWERMRTAYSWKSGGPGSALWKSGDGGKTWRKITRGLPSGPLGRIGLSYFRKNPRVVLATVEAEHGGVFRSTDGGESWTRVNVLNPRPFYFSTIHQDPTDEDRIYVLGVQFHVSADRGRTFRTVPMNIHVDHHAIWIDPKDSNHLLIGNDGGVAQSRDRGRTWEHINTMTLGQFYAIGFDMRKPYYVYGGLQDNGSWGGPTQTKSGGVEYHHWYGVGGGDGFYVQVDPNDWTTVYSESQGGALNRVDQTTGESRFIRPRAPQGETYRFNWNSPIFISPHNSRTIYFGGNRLFKSVNRGDDWKVVSPDLTTNETSKLLRGFGVTPEDTTAENHCTITTISESPRKQGVLWVGTDDGLVHVSQDDGAAWTNVTANIPGLPKNTWCSRVEASRHADGRCYATFTGHRNDDRKAYVYVTEDYGKTWTSLANGIPEGDACHVVREGRLNPDLLFLGTEMSLWISLNRGKTWQRYRAGDYPTAIVHDLAIHPRELDLIVGTHARSIWTIPVAPLEQLNAAALSKDVFLCRPSTAYLLGRITGRTWNGDRGFRSPNTQPGVTVYYYLRQEAKEAPRVRFSDVEGNVLGELASLSKAAGLNAAGPWGLRGNRGLLRRGAYRVTLTVDGQDYVTSFDVEDISETTPN
jgi:photosystem II stability/assembly factor-like uncharacterized protein